MLKNKKAFMTQVFFYILLALLLFIPTILFASQFFAGTKQADTSFDNLVKYVNEIAKDPGYISDSIPLYMDENTFILFINPEVKSVWARFGIIKEGFELKGTSDFFMDRQVMSSCKLDQSCICLCKDYDKGKIFHTVPNEPDYPSLTTMDYYKPVCNKMICTSTDEKFISGADVMREWSTEKGTGVIITREKGDARLRTVYLEEYGGYINVCFDPPCINQPMKNIIDMDRLLDKINGIYGSCKKTDNKDCICSSKRKFELVPEGYDIRMEHDTPTTMNMILERASDKKEISRKTIDTARCSYDFDRKALETKESVFRLDALENIFTNTDIDGDGIQNDEDDDIDNDAIPNKEDKDVDGDGWAGYDIDTKNLVFYKSEENICIGTHSRGSDWYVNTSQAWKKGSEPVKFC